MGVPVSAQTMEEQLERGQVVYFASCPFPVPQGDDLAFLLAQHLASRAHKNISYTPKTGKTGGFQKESSAQAERLRDLLARFSLDVTQWLATALPRYARQWRLDQVSFRPEQEATRKLRLNARNDLLHVDAFPSRPTHGQRILRVFANINPIEPRVWVTSDPFARLLERFGKQAGLPSEHRLGLVQHLRTGVIRLFKPTMERSAYDEFMLRFHDFLKANDQFQEHGPKRIWTFPPGSAWLAMTDTCSHAVLRGRYAMEHSYFISPTSLVLPDESPAALLARACGTPVLRQAA